MTSGRIDKENILREYQNNQAIKDIVYFVFNPYIVTGMSKKKFNKQVLNDWTYDCLDIEDVMNYLKKHNTGSDRDIANIQHFVLKNPDYTYLIYQIVCKDISLGIQPKTINKIWGKNFIPQFDVMLAEKYFDDPEKYLPKGTDFILTLKLDGTRCVLLFDDNHSPHFFTRSGREIEDLVEISADAVKLDPAYIYDGELLAETTGASKDVYRDTVSIVGSNNIKSGLIFNVFDKVPHADFMKGYSPEPALNRKLSLHAELSAKNLSYIKEVEMFYVGRDQSKIQEWLDWAHANNKEGTMINIASAGYECKRSSQLLKVKTFAEVEAYVISLEEGTGKNVGKLGAITTQIKDKEGNLHQVKVGSGFNDEERNLYWQHPELLKNKVVEISYFEVTTNKVDDSLSLRFPTWLGRVRNDKAFEEMNHI